MNGPLVLTASLHVQTPFSYKAQLNSAFLPLSLISQANSAGFFFYFSPTGLVFLKDTIHRKLWLSARFEFLENGSFWFFMS